MREGVVDDNKQENQERRGRKMSRNEERKKLKKGSMRRSLEGWARERAKSG